MSEKISTFMTELAYVSLRNPKEKFEATALEQVTFFSDINF